MNGFFKAFRVPVRVRYHSGFHLQTKAGKSYKTMKQIRERWRELDREEFRIELEAQNFADAIDVILYIEA